jgi:hypothetical protein
MKVLSTPVMVRNGASVSADYLDGEMAKTALRK